MQGRTKMMLRWSGLAGLLILSSGGLPLLAQVDVPFFLKGAVLMAPLQGLALLYVAYWNWRRSVRPPNPPSNTVAPGQRYP